MERKKQQVPPLRFAPVGMTNFLKLGDLARKINSKPEGRCTKLRALEFDSSLEGDHAR